MSSKRGGGIKGGAGDGVEKKGLHTRCSHGIGIGNWGTPPEESDRRGIAKAIGIKRITFRSRFKKAKGQLATEFPERF